MGSRISGGQAANISSSFFVENWRPTHGAVGGLPDPAASRAEIIGCRIAGNSRSGQRASAAERADQAILHALEELVFRFGRFGFAAGLLVRRSIRCRRRGWVGLDGLRLTPWLSLGKCRAGCPKRHDCKK